MASNTKTLTQLAQTILDNASILEAHFEKNNLPPPTFEEDAPDYGLFQDVQLEKARVASASACQELFDLLVGPNELIRPKLCGTSLQYIYKHDLASKVPLNGSITYDELAKKSGLQAEKLRRLLRYAITSHHIFQEKSEGVVSHSAASKALATSKPALASVGLFYDEIYQSFAHAVEALDRDENHKTNATGWNIAHRSDKPMWDYHKEHPEMSERMSQTMVAISTGYGHDLASLVHGYRDEWTALAARSGKLVDIGGATGFVSIELARNYPGLHCIVQDVQHVTESTKAAGLPPADVKQSVEFKTHDLREAQPEAGADVYLFRQVLKDWPDADCVVALRALVPAMKKGARVVIHDILVPPPSRMPLLAERHVRQMDMIMLSLFNSKEREEQDWRALFTEADARFADFRVIHTEASPMAIIEATWSE